MNTGNIYYAVEGDRAFLKLVGVIRYPLSQRLSLAVGQIFARAIVKSVVLDLQQSEFIDSTCLGLLARVATRCLELNCDRPILVSTQPEINRVLRSMGFDQVFVLVDNPAEPAANLDNAAKLAGLSSRVDPQLILEAHRALCEMNTKNQSLFHAVLEQLESDAGATDASRFPRATRPL